MTVSLLLDLGASRLKACLYDHASDSIVAEHDVPAPTPDIGPAGEIEVPGDAHATRVRILCEDLIAEAGAVPARALICSEMHGFALVGPGRRVSPYHSWRDERAVRSGTFEALRSTLGGRFRVLTGMKLKPGLPLVTLAHMARAGALPPQARLVSLPELVIAQLGRLAGTIDETMAAGLGLYDIGARAWSPSLVALLGPSAPRLLRPVSAGMRSIGTLRLAGTDVPVVAAVGDLQAAVHGADCAAPDTLCVNVGTGSQVNRIGYSPTDPFVEERPFFGGRRMATISHIPAGRALRVLEGFFDSIAPEAGLFWNLAADLSSEEVASAPLRVDLNCFAGAWRHRDGGAIAGFGEGTLTGRGLAAGAIRAMVDQYLDAIALVDPAGSCRDLVLAGGVPRRLPAFVAELRRRSGHRLRMLPATEETLAGLRLLARTIAPTPLAAPATRWRRLPAPAAAQPEARAAA